MGKSRKNKVSTKTLIIIIAALFAVLIVVAFFGVKEYKSEKAQQRSEENSRALEQMTATVTFPEGYCVPQMAELLEEKGICSKEAFLDAVKNPDEKTVKDLGIPNASEKIFVLEGYLYPDTYEFYKNEDPRAVVKKMIDNFKSKITGEHRKKAAELGYDFDEILSVASIIQKEAGYESENKKVSSVIHNRLRESMQLQCDVTENYLEKYVKPNVKHYSGEYENNYDTFKCSAIPAGAICSPSLSCIEAALYPDKTDYLFFVTDSRDTSKFYYASTYEEHLENCREAGYTGY